MTDTLKVELCEKTIELVHGLVTKNNSSSSNEIWPVIITVIGMLLVATITIISQHILTKRTLKADLTKIQKQIQSDFESKNKFEWISNFRKIVSELIVITDPEYNLQIDKLKMSLLITQIEIMLDESVDAEKSMISLTTELGLKSDALKQIGNDSEILKIHSAIINQTRKIIKEKQLLNL